LRDKSGNPIVDAIIVLRVKPDDLGYSTKTSANDGLSFETIPSILDCLRTPFSEAASASSATRPDRPGKSQFSLKLIY
jgi:hypothetical protein